MHIHHPYNLYFKPAISTSRAFCLQKSLFVRFIHSAVNASSYNEKAWALVLNVHAFLMSRFLFCREWMV